MRAAMLAVMVAVLVLSPGCLCRGDPDRPPSVEEEGQHFLLCGRLADDGGEEEVRAGPVTLLRDGFELTLQGEGDGRTKLGVMAGVEEWTEPNRANVAALGEWFASEGAEAIVIAGGLGADRETCLNVLGAVAESGLPVFPVIGASADFAGYRRAVAQARERHPNIVDLTVARLVHWDGVDLVSLPGYHNPFYLRHRRGGCAYQRSDIRDLRRLVRSARSKVLLVAADAPRGRGRHAVDFGRGGANIGSPLLADFLEANEVDYGIFGHVYEAGGRGTADAAGLRRVSPETWSPSLFVNPGAVEAVPYDLGELGWSRGMGAIVEIGPEGARYRLHRIGDRSPPGS